MLSGANGPQGGGCTERFGRQVIRLPGHFNSYYQLIASCCEGLGQATSHPVDKHPKWCIVVCGGGARAGAEDAREK